MNTACIKINIQMNHQGQFTKSVVIDKVMTPKIAKSEYSINNKSLRLLSVTTIYPYDNCRRHTFLGYRTKRSTILRSTTSNTSDSINTNWICK